MADSNIQVGAALLAAWNAHDLQHITNFYAADYLGKDVGQPQPHYAPSGQIDILARYIEAFPDANWTGDSITQGNTVALIWTMWGMYCGTLMQIPLGAELAQGLFTFRRLRYKLKRRIICSSSRRGL